jgi:hypothetical protein
MRGVSYIFGIDDYIHIKVVYSKHMRDIRMSLYISNFLLTRMTKYVRFFIIISDCVKSKWKKKPMDFMIQ